MPLPPHAIFILSLGARPEVATWVEARLRGAFGIEALFRDSVVGRNLALRRVIQEAEIAIVVIDPAKPIADDELTMGRHFPDQLTSSDVLTALLQHKLSSGEPLSVIPLLIDHAELPAAHDLPDSLRALHQNECHPFRSDDVESSLNRLVDRISETCAEQRINAASSAMATELDLSKLSLKSLPHSLCQLSQLLRLDVSGNQLTALPESIGQLSQLQRLDISSNQLPSLPEGMGQLSQLQHLDVSSNQLTTLPDFIRQFLHLRNLAASNNQLTALPASLGHLARLLSIDVSNNQLTALPEDLGELSQLQRLDVSINQMTALPDSVGQLASLWSLNVSGNQLTTLPDSLGQLWQLQVLNASMNQLIALPDSLGLLMRVESLYASDNQLLELPESIEKLSSLRQLHLHGNDALGIPAEVLGPPLTELPTDSLADPALILDYYFMRVHGRPLNEAKLILVGRGGVGKTSLIKRLVHGTFNELEPETPGINIEPWEITVSDSDKVRLHVWDFGGQRILHGTHQFFLTERTLYLLVLSGREDSATQDAEYWLQLIKSFGGQSRVIVALNKMHEHPFDVNRGLLFEKYSFISDFVKTDCKEPTVGISELHQLIRTQTDALEHRKTAFPADWFSIKDRLATMPENFITWDNYQQLCREHGETDPQAQRDLARFLHILGIALNYANDPRLQDTRVLKPTWVTDGIYTLLRALQQENNGGVLRPIDLLDALDEEQYPAARHDFLIRLMEKFQLCFRLPGKEERYLVPELLDENQPDLKELLDSPGLGFRYQYEVLPEGLLPRFIVQTHVHSETNPQWRWRTGVVLDRDGCRAVVRGDVRERRVDVHVVGPEARRRGLLAIVRAAFDEQHRDFKGLSVDERVPIPGETGVTESYRHLLRLEEEGEMWCRPSGSNERHRVKALLNGVESEKSRERKRVYERLQGSVNRAATPKEDNRMMKTVVELDLVGYSTICDNLEQSLDVKSVAQLNSQIQSFIDAGLNEIGAERSKTVMTTTGDGAILVFDLSVDAHDFANAVHEATRKHNKDRQQHLAKRVFRIGAATGEIVMKWRPDGGFDIAGSTIARAVRLEAKAAPGGLLIDQKTLDTMTTSQKALYGPKFSIAGKRDEKFDAFACQLNQDGPKDASFFGTAKKEIQGVNQQFGRDTRREILNRFKLLKPHQYPELIFLLEVPIGQRPQETLNLDQQKEQVLRWAEEDAGLDVLLAVLRELTDHPSN